jgi:hypothetical protein
VLAVQSLGCERWVGVVEAAVVVVVEAAVMMMV